MNIAVYGAGIFGLASAVALARRGQSVTLYDPNPLPHDRAASYDISKAIRGSYGTKTPLYAPLVLEARAEWRNLERRSGRTILHEIGGLHLALRDDESAFELTSERELRRLAWPVEVWDPAACAKAMPGFAMQGIRLGVYDRYAGWLDALQALYALSEEATQLGVRLEVGKPPPPWKGAADAVVMAIGAWFSTEPGPWSQSIRTSEQHEGFFATDSSTEDLGRSWPFWSLDLDDAGYYGFPTHPRGILKVACHRPGPVADPRGSRAPSAAASATLRAFLRCHIHTAAHLEDQGRTCLYTLTPDHDWIIDEHPGHPGVFVAGGGSGHAFKFGPTLGRLLAERLLDGIQRPQFALSRLNPR